MLKSGLVLRAVTLALLSLCGAVASSQEILVIDGSRVNGPVDLFDTAAEPPSWAEREAADPNGRPVVAGAQRFVTLNLNEIRRVFNPGNPTPFRVELRFLKDYSYTIVVEDIRIRPGSGARQVSGRVRGDDSSRLSLTMTDDHIRGTLHTGSVVLEFRKAGAVSLIQVLDPTQFPKERQPRKAHRQEGFDANAQMPFGPFVVIPTGGGAPILEPYDGEPYADTAFEPAEFTVLALMSTVDFPGACDTSSLQLAGDAYTQSLAAVFGEYALGTVSFECVTPPVGTDWSTLESIRQFLMTPPIAARRDAAAADLVVMIVSDGLGFCGYTMYPDYPLYPIELYGDQYKENAAFAVVDESCALGHFSFAHEIGHLLGMKHERFNESGGVSDYCGYGYPVRRFGRPIEHTVMAYDDYCDYVGVSCVRVAHLSIPRKKASGSLAWFRNWWHRAFGRIKGKSCNGQNSGHLRRPANNYHQLIDAAGLVAEYR